MYSIEWRNRYWYCVPEMSKMKMNKLPSTRHASHSRVCVCVCLCLFNACTNMPSNYKYSSDLWVTVLCLFINCSSPLFFHLYRPWAERLFLPHSPSIWTHLFTSTLSMYNSICVSTLHIWKRIYHINNRVMRAKRTVRLNFFSIKLWLSLTLTPLNARANEFTSVKHMIRCIKLIER